MITSARNSTYTAVTAAPRPGRNSSASTASPTAAALPPMTHRGARALRSASAAASGWSASPSTYPAATISPKPLLEYPRPSRKLEEKEYMRQHSIQYSPLSAA